MRGLTSPTSQCGYSEVNFNLKIRETESQQVWPHRRVARCWKFNYAMVKPGDRFLRLLLWE